MAGFPFWKLHLEMYDRFFSNFVVSTSTQSTKVRFA